LSCLLLANAIADRFPTTRCSASSPCEANLCCISSANSKTGTCAPLGAEGSFCYPGADGPFYNRACPCAEGLYCKATIGTVAAGVCTRRASDCEPGQVLCTESLAVSVGCTVSTCYSACANGHLRCTSALHEENGCAIGSCVTPCPPHSEKCTPALHEVDGCRFGTCMAPCPEGKERCTTELHEEIKCALGTCIVRNACEPDPCEDGDICVPEADNNFCDSPPCYSCQSPSGRPCNPNGSSQCPNGYVCEVNPTGSWSCHLD